MDLQNSSTKKRLLIIFIYTIVIGLISALIVMRMYGSSLASKTNKEQADMILNCETVKIATDKIETIIKNGEANSFIFKKMKMRMLPKKIEDIKELDTLKLCEMSSPDGLIRIGKKVMIDKNENSNGRYLTLSLEANDKLIQETSFFEKFYFQTFGYSLPNKISDISKRLIEFSENQKNGYIGFALIQDVVHLFFYNRENSEVENINKIEGDDNLKALQIFCYLLNIEDETGQDYEPESENEHSNTTNIGDSQKDSKEGESFEGKTTDESNKDSAGNKPKKEMANEKPTDKKTSTPDKSKEENKLPNEKPTDAKTSTPDKPDELKTAKSDKKEEQKSSTGDYKKSKLDESKLDESKNQGVSTEKKNTDSDIHNGNPKEIGNDLKQEISEPEIIPKSSSKALKLPIKTEDPQSTDVNSHIEANHTDVYQMQPQYKKSGEELDKPMPTKTDHDVVNPNITPDNLNYEEIKENSPKPEEFFDLTTNIISENELNPSSKFTETQIDQGNPFLTPKGIEIIPTPGPHELKAEKNIFSSDNGFSKQQEINLGVSDVVHKQGDSNNEEKKLILKEDDSDSNKFIFQNNPDKESMMDSIISDQEEKGRNSSLNLQSDSSLKKQSDSFKTVESGNTFNKRPSEGDDLQDANIFKQTSEDSLNDFSSDSLQANSNDQNEQSGSSLYYSASNNLPNQIADSYSNQSESKFDQYEESDTSLKSSLTVQEEKDGLKPSDNIPKEESDTSLKSSLTVQEEKDGLKSSDNIPKEESDTSFKSSLTVQEEKDGLKSFENIPESDTPLKSPLKVQEEY
ncbi:hypothetical protein DMUE_4745 [Dictyocoela muelleri]|nr:hypothetical protein DMUE_4745 [Dictyocoela muelleri]